MENLFVNFLKVFCGPSVEEFGGPTYSTTLNQNLFLHDY